MALSLEDIDRDISEDFDIHCLEPSRHDIVFRNEIMAKDQHILDPDPDNNVKETTHTVECVTPVQINIKPGSDPNAINPMIEGVIPVALLGWEGFDVNEVDVTTLAFGPGDAAFDHIQGPHFEDVNADGLPDLIAHFRIEEAGIAFGDMEACLRGQTLDGKPFGGCDAVRTVPDMDGEGCST